MLFNVLVSVFCALTFPACAHAASNNAEVPAETEIPADETIQLKEPDKTLSVSLMQALSDRKSQREFAEKPLSLETLSSLLWAANGVNRPDGRRTAPSAVNSQDIDIYVCLASGAYLYDAKQHRLVRVTTDDVRKQVAGRQPMAAPVFLVLVGDVANSNRDGSLGLLKGGVEIQINLLVGFVLIMQSIDGERGSREIVAHHKEKAVGPHAPTSIKNGNLMYTCRIIGVARHGEGSSACAWELEELLDDTFPHDGHRE